jgi:hypothetical protein
MIPLPTIAGTRREFLRGAFCGFGSMALASLVRADGLRAAAVDPLAPKPPHLPAAKAKAVIFLFMAGGAPAISKPSTPSRS